VSNKTTVSYKFPLGATGGRKARATDSAITTPKPTPAAPTTPSRAAQMLALAHHVERLIEAGDVQSVATIARTLGLTRARLTQVMQLLLLAPEIQEQILLGQIHCGERRLRPVVKAAAWAEQSKIGNQLRKPASS